MKNGGLLYIVPKREIGSKIGNRIHENTYFTDTLSAETWGSGKFAIALCSLEENYLTHLCLVKKGQRVATYKNRLTFTDFYELDSPVLFTAIESEISSSVTRYFLRVIDVNGGWLSKGTWNEVMRVLRQKNSSVDEQISKIMSLRAFQNIDLQKDTTTLSLEMDSYLSIARWAGFQKLAEEDLSYLRVPDFMDEEELPSLVKAVQEKTSVRISEDEVLAFEAKQFGDWDTIKEYVTGEKLFKKEDTSLMIRNVNRHSIEKTLGVDLVYYNQSYQSFVLVQYKKMRQETKDKKYRYRPDLQFRKELSRMQEYRDKFDISSPTSTALINYRFNSGAFYFKFYESEDFNPNEPSLVKGMHVPLDYWELFEKSGESKGTRGGVYLDYDNVGRYFNNTDFRNLIASGMIGSTGDVTDVIKSIVEPLIDMDHSVTVGIKI